MCNAERVEKRAHHRPLLGEMVEDERASGQSVRKRRQAGQMLRLALDIERDDGFRPELLAIGNEQRRLNLIVDSLIVGPERARRAQLLIRRHLFPQPGGGRGRVGH